MKVWKAVASIVMDEAHDRWQSCEEHYAEEVTMAVLQAQASALRRVIALDKHAPDRLVRGFVILVEVDRCEPPQSMESHLQENCLERKPGNRGATPHRN